MGLWRSAVRGARLYINLGKTFLRISRIRNIFLTWILARVFVYLPPFISQIPDFIYWTVLILNLIYFEWRDAENQQYNERSANLQPCQRPCYSFSRIPSKWKWRKNNPLLDTSFLFSTKNPNDRIFDRVLDFSRETHPKLTSPSSPSSTTISSSSSSSSLSSLLVPINTTINVIIIIIIVVLAPGSIENSAQCLFYIFQNKSVFVKWAKIDKNCSKLF